MHQKRRSKMKYLGTERFKKGRYGWQEYSYYAVADKLEERINIDNGKNIAISRYIGIPADKLAVITDKIAELSKSERKSPRGHNELFAMLRRYSSVHGFVTPDEVDKPTRKIVVSAAVNMPFDSTTQSW